MPANYAAFWLDGDVDEGFDVFAACLPCKVGQLFAQCRIGGGAVLLGFFHGGFEKVFGGSFAVFFERELRKVHVAVRCQALFFLACGFQRVSFSFLWTRWRSFLLNVRQLQTIACFIVFDKIHSKLV